jgi:hypothetical protein
VSPNFQVVEKVRDAVENDAFWRPYLDESAISLPPEVAVHLGVFVEPYLQFVLNGQKTIESRFSIHRRPPFGCVKEGDVLLLKQTGGPVVGVARIGVVWSYELNPESFSELRSEFTAALCAQDPMFWENRSSASFATLMQLQNVRPVSPIVVHKRDQRGWMVIRRRSRQLLLW